MPISDADRLFLAQSYRYVEVSDTTVQARFAGAQDGTYASPFVTADGANAVLTIIKTALDPNNRIVSVTVDQVLDLTFHQRPPTVTLLTSRFGGDTTAGRKMLVERADKDRLAGTTTLYLLG